MESEAKEISHKIDEMVEEHNRLLEIIKRLREIAQQLELGNLAKARDIVSHHQKLSNHTTYFLFLIPKY